MSKRSFIDEAEDVALEGLKAMKAYLAYQGSNKEYLQKAKVGASAVQGFTRHYASLTNREMLKLAAERQRLELAEKPLPKELPSGDD